MTKRLAAAALLLSAAGLLSSCETTIPEDDDTAPNVRLTTGSRVISTSDQTDRARPSIDCPDGAGIGGEDVLAVASFPIPVTVLVSDGGGVQAAEVRIEGGDFQNVPPGVTTASRTVGDATIRTATATYPRSAPRTAQTFTIDVVATGGSRLFGSGSVSIDARGTDYSGNDAFTGRPVVGTQSALCR